MSIKLAEGVVEVTADATGVPGQIARQIDDNGAPMDGAGKRSGGRMLAGIGLALGASALIGLGVGVGQAISEGIRQGFAFTVDGVGLASDLAETRSAVDQVFGSEVSAQIQGWASSANRALGQTQQQALEAARTYGIFGQSAGLSGEALGAFTTDMVTLSADLASFSNTSPEQAIEAIGAALRGEAEPIRAYGVLLDDATLKNRAMAMGLINTTKNALTPQQRVLAAQAEILAQTSVQQGDFTRTSGGLANQQKILSASFEETKAKLGNALLPAITTLVAFANDSLIPILDDVVTEIGPELADAIKESTPAFLDLIQTIAPLIPDLVRLGVSAIPGVIWAVKTIVPLLIDWTKNTKFVWDTVSSFFRFINGDMSLRQLIRVVMNSSGSFRDMASVVGGVVGRVVGFFARLASGAGEWIGRAVAIVAGLPRRVSNAIGNLGRTLYSSGRALIQGFINGINAMLGPLGNAVGGAMDWISGFFPSSPAKRGAFSGDGWARIGRAGEAISEQFTSRMRTDVELGASFAGASLAAAGAPGSFSPLSRRAASAGETKVYLEQKIYSTDPILGARQAAREVTRYLGV